MGIGVQLRDNYKQIISPRYHCLFNHKDSTYILKDCIGKIKNLEIETNVWTRLYVTDLKKLKKLLKESGVDIFRIHNFYTLLNFWVSMYYNYKKHDMEEDYIDIEFNW